MKGKVVLDLGCGSGILSCFAAKCGARVVIAIDMSTIANTAKKVIAANNLESVVTVFQKKIEDCKVGNCINPCWL